MTRPTAPAWAAWMFTGWVVLPEPENPLFSRDSSDLRVFMNSGCSASRSFATIRSASARLFKSSYWVW